MLMVMKFKILKKEKSNYFEFMHENDVNIFKEDIKDAILNDKKCFF